MTKGDPFVSYLNPETNVYKTKSYDKGESAVVEKVILASRRGKPNFVRIVLRHDRSPIIGDKFASRHG